MLELFIVEDVRAGEQYAYTSEGAARKRLNFINNIDCEGILTSILVDVSKAKVLAHVRKPEEVPAPEGVPA